jgi:hypothetical protein
VKQRAVEREVSGSYAVDGNLDGAGGRSASPRSTALRW